MVRRIISEVVLIVGITIVLAWLVLGVLALTDSADPVGTLVDQTPRLLFGILGIALALWTVLVIIGVIVHRDRGAGWRIATHLISLAVALVVNIGLLAIIAAATSRGGGDDWGMLVVAIAVGAGAVLAVSGVIAVLIVDLVILRPKRGGPAE